MYSIKCSRCGKPIISSKPTGECTACQSRRANGKRLAGDRAEQLAWERDEENRLELATLSDFYGPEMAKRLVGKGY
jgi:acetyl-CoA carboxylase carboxyltransferase component